MTFISDIDQWCSICVNEPIRIASAMRRIGRFGGQHPTSNVLWHSLEVAWMCRTLSPDAQIWALYHDAHEVLSGDVTRPFKTPGLTDLQNKADAALIEAFVLKIEPEEMELIHQADQICGDNEHKYWSVYQWNFAPSYDRWLAVDQFCDRLQYFELLRRTQHARA